MIDFADIHTADLHVGDKLLLGLTMKPPCAVAEITRLTKTQIVLLTPGAFKERRYERKTGYEVGSRALGLRIKGLATPEEALAVEHQRVERLRKAEEDYAAREAINLKRAGLVALFPGGYQASVSADMIESGKWILSLERLSDLDIKELADFMHMPEFRFRT